MGSHCSMNYLSLRHQSVTCCFITLRENRGFRITMKFLLVLFVISAMLMVANAEISFRDILKMYDMSQNNIADSVKVATEALYIPMSLKACTNNICDEVCKFLGFHHGVCVSSTTCNCSN